MISFSAHNFESRNQFRFYSLIKNDTYAFLHFKPYKRRPENFRVKVSVYENDNTLFEEHCFTLELDSTKKLSGPLYWGSTKRDNSKSCIYHLEY